MVRGGTHHHPTGVWVDRFWKTWRGSGLHSFMLRNEQGSPKWLWWGGDNNEILAVVAAVGFFRLHSRRNSCFIFTYSHKCCLTSVPVQCGFTWHKQTNKQTAAPSREGPSLFLIANQSLAELFHVRKDEPQSWFFFSFPLPKEWQMTFLVQWGELFVMLTTVKTQGPFCPCSLAIQNLLLIFQRLIFTNSSVILHCMLTLLFSWDINYRLFIIDTYVSFF